MAITKTATTAAAGINICIFNGSGRHGGYAYANDMASYLGLVAQRVESKRNGPGAESGAIAGPWMGCRGMGLLRPTASFFADHG
jgi:hypothetical protein